MKLSAFLQDTFSPSKGGIKISTKGIIEGYREKYASLTKDPSKKFSHVFYTIVPGGRKILHIKVPSETVDNFHYDVLFELEVGDAKTLEACDIRVFSNCPSFVYSLAYVYAHWTPDSTSDKKFMFVDVFKKKLPRDSMLIHGLDKKLGKLPIHDQPVTRNPMGIPLFDKSLYFAVFYMQENLTLPALLQEHHNITFIQLAANIPEFDSLMVKRKREANKTKRRKAFEKEDTKEAFVKTEKSLHKTNSRGVLSPQSAKRPITVTGTKAVRSASAIKKPKSTGR